MESLGYTITRKQLGIILTGSIILLLVGSYFAVPAIQAGVYSLTTQEDTTCCISEQGEDIDEFPYEKFKLTYETKYYTYTSFVNPGEEMYKKTNPKNSDESMETYKKPVGTNYYYKYERLNLKSPEETLVIDRGDYLTHSKGNISIVDVSPYHYTSPNVFSFKAHKKTPDKIGAGDYEKTGTTIYHNHTVNVLKKTWTSSGDIVLFNESVIYTDTKTNVVVYMDNVDFFIKNYTMESLDKNIEQPKWINSIEFNSVSEMKTASINVGSKYRGQSYVLHITGIYADPKPIKVNSEIPISISKDKKEITNTTVKYKELRSGFYLTKNGKLIFEDSLDDTEIDGLVKVQNSSSYTVKITPEYKTAPFVFKMQVNEKASDYADGQGISTEQMIFDRTIETEEDKLKYSIDRKYSINPVVLQYGKQKQEIDKNRFLRFPVSDNNTLTFDRTDVTHFSINTENEEIILDPVEGNYTSGTILLPEDHLVDFDNPTVVLKQNGETIAYVDVSSNDHYIANVPTGEVQMVIEQGDKTYTRTVTVEENNTVYP